MHSSHAGMIRSMLTTLALLALAVPVAFAKGGGVGYWIELQQPRIDFTDWQCPVVTADAIRATDHDLK